MKVREGLFIALGGIAFVAISLSFYSFFSSPPSSSSKKVLYWIDPMEPQIHYDSPGKSRMNMDLVPVYEEDQESSKNPVLKISPAIVNNLGVRTSIVEEGPISLKIKAFGSVKADENKVSHIHSYVEGWVQKLYTKEFQKFIEKDAPLFELYSRDLQLTQREYLLELRFKEKSAGSDSLSKLKALGMSDKQINELQKTQKISPLVTIYAPQKGYIDNLNIREGMWVKPETTIMSITDPSTVWIIAEVFPAQLSLIKQNQNVKIYLPFDPQKTWQGKVDYIYPEIDPSSLTSKIRVILDNPDYFFKANMPVEVEFEGTSKNALIVPSEAVIWESDKARVIIALEEGKFQPRSVTTGVESEGRIEIVSGLNKGEKIVTSAQFLLDSEINMKSALQRMEDSSVSSNHSSHGHAP